ncbi:hypothetical protein QVD17_17348 [Tagetes erecta]|uniref:E3 ubiquitin-protein ligase CHIP n=1 Tax=Tagetes erecta TaxID=13708 RepID=A0AAD8KVU6_TARER|nr:hypothetical protein QVD17_17348 [Tagetes erecta]
MSKAVSSAAEQAEQLKLQGNNFYNENMFAAAIDLYTQAIRLCPNVPFYWTNRALCHRKLNDWASVEEDCLRAVRLDPRSVKGHYMLGLALLHRDIYPEGIRALERALDLGRAHQDGHMVEEIWHAFATAKFDEWVEDSTQRVKNLKELEKSCELGLWKKLMFDIQEAEEKEINKLFLTTGGQLRALNSVFSKVAEADTPTDIPDYLRCKITLDILLDPVITPCGITYEKAALIQHIKKVGNFDPTTRQPLHPFQFVPNLAIKEAVANYLDQHRWAYKVD